MNNNFNETMNEMNNISVTENGAIGLESANNNLVDLNFRVASNHDNVSDKDSIAFENALKDNTKYAVKWMFYLRDIREGLGERDSFVKLFITFYDNNEEAALKALNLIPEFGRWKDMFDIAEFVYNRGPKYRILVESIYSIISAQLVDDCSGMKANNPISLLAKWMPSINASNKARCAAKHFCSYTKMPYDKYRKMLSKLRSYVDVTEVKTCSNNWGKIDYNKVSSNANSRYHNSFAHHDKIRWEEHLEKLQHPLSGDVMHAENLYPYEVYAKYTHKSKGYREAYEYDAAIEAMWNNLKDTDSVGTTMVVCDGSGSMMSNIGKSSIWAIDVSRSLSVYFAERCKGKFKNKVIEFSSRPHYIDLSCADTLAKKATIMDRYDDCSNTNLKGVFDLVLKTAVKNNLKQDEIPSRFLIVSDMEFDASTTISESFYSYSSGDNGFHNKVMGAMKTLFDEIKAEWAAAGYVMPHLVFWNVNSRTNTIPVSSNECGVSLVSGFSVNAVKCVLAGEAVPWLALKKVLDSPRYDKIDAVLA